MPVVPRADSEYDRVQAPERPVRVAQAVLPVAWVLVPVLELDRPEPDWVPPEQGAPLVELAHVPMPVLVPRELVSVRQGQVVPPAESEFCPVQEQARPESAPAVRVVRPAESACVRVPEQAQRAWAWVQRA